MNHNKHEALFSATAGDTIDAEARTTLNVVIAYDDVPAGQHAMHILGDVADNFGSNIELRPQLWAFRFLDNPDWRALAAKDVLEADMLIISTSSENELPAAVRNWFNSCLAQRCGADLAVIALLGSPDKLDEHYSARFQYVQRAVSEASCDFFAPAPHPEDSLDANIENIRHRADTVTPILDDILHLPTAPLHWHSHP
jgi:hypothetical protein